MVTGRDALLPSHSAKQPVSFYEYVDPAVHNGFLYFYSVTASDHSIRINPNNTMTVIGAGLVGDPGSSFMHTNPGVELADGVERERDGADIFVYPNPATREALAEFQQFSPNSDDPTGVRVNFTAQPAPRPQHRQDLHPRRRPRRDDRARRDRRLRGSELNRRPQRPGSGQRDLPVHRSVR